MSLEVSDLESLMSMGFSRERAEEALTETNNAGIEVALEWLLVTEGVVDSADSVGTIEKEGYTQESDGTKSCDSSHTRNNFSQTQSISVPNKMPVNSATEARILVRLLNGKTLSQIFNANDKLNDIFLWIQSQIPGERFDLMTNFPKKIFTDEDYTKTLQALHLIPSAVVIVTQPDKWNDLRGCRAITNDDENRKKEEKKRKEETEKQVKEMEEERLALERVRCQIEGDKAARRQRWPHLYQNSEQPSQNSLQVQHSPLSARNDQNRNNKKFE